MRVPRESTMLELTQCRLQNQTYPHTKQSYLHGDIQIIALIYTLANTLHARAWRVIRYSTGWDRIGTRLLGSPTGSRTEIASFAIFV